MNFEIGEAARRAGVRPSAIRYYEKQGLLSAERGSGGRRVFTMEAVERLALIRHAKALGFSLDEIRQLMRAFPDKRWSDLAAAKLVEVDALLRSVEDMRAGLQRISGCRCRDLQQCAHAIAEKQCAD
jgi:MerR family transcriptional regulator, redox-sensitive transcriptional activator SoxR